MFKIRKTLMRLTATALSICMLTIASLAYTGTGTVKVNTYLNVRSSASTSASIIGKLYNGTNVTITGSTNGWYKINYNGGSGWVSSSYITTSSKATTVVNTAKSCLGVKYIYGGATTSGFDCSGLTMYCYSKIGITLPHNSLAQSKLGTYIKRTNLQPGDLIFFDTSGGKSINHVGIYIGNNSFISAQSGAGSVKTASLSTSYWSTAYVTARRYIS